MKGNAICDDLSRCPTGQPADIEQAQRTSATFALIGTNQLNENIFLAFHRLIDKIRHRRVTKKSALREVNQASGISDG
jgi:hypothetical protein